MRRAALILFVLVCAAGTDAQVYTYRDTDGIFRFTSVPAPGAVPFDVGRPWAATSARDRVYDAIIREAAATYAVEDALVKAVIHVESRFDPGAVSHRGARGLMQLMPRTAKRYGAVDLHDPRQNVHAGVRYLRSLFERFSRNTTLALAAYHAGPTAVRRHRGVPPYPRTVSYVDKVRRWQRHYRNGADTVAISDRSPSARSRPISSSSRTGSP